MDNHGGAGLCLREGLCAEVDGDWHIYIIEKDEEAEGVFYVAGWPYSAAGYPLDFKAPRLLDIWELGSAVKFISPERMAAIRQRSAA